MTIAIDDPADPRIAAYRDVRDRDLKGRGGLFMIEGEVVLRVALTRGRHPVTSILLARNRVAALADALDGCPPEVPVYVVTPEVIETVAGFPLHRGVLAVGRRAEPKDSWETMLPPCPARTLVVVLSGISNHDNMGGLFRNAAAFGASLVLLDDRCCDPLYRKAIRVSAGAALTVPFRVAGKIRVVCATLASYGFAVLATSPGGREEISTVEPSARDAVVLGAEGPGLPGDLLAELRTIRIGMSPDFDSLNVATASGIILHRLRVA